MKGMSGLLLRYKVILVAELPKNGQIVQKTGCEC